MKPQDMVTLSFYKELSPYKEDGSVMLVQHIDTNRLFVMKQVSVHNKDLYLTLQQLEVPGTPKIHHVLDLDDDNLIIIEDYIGGETLETIMQSQRIFTEAEAIQILLQLCDALLMLHSTEPPIIHRDIKPSNIIISNDLDATLIDFDASKTYDPDKNQDTVLMGTLNYAAPEQFGFSQSDARTDIYALGVLLNKLLTGFLPKDLMYKGALSGVVKKCTYMEPDERYASVSALAKVLEKHALRVQKEILDAAIPPEKKSWVPPGFRSKKTWKKVIAILGYATLIWFAAISEFEGMGQVQSLMNQIAIIGWGLTVVALFMNYHGLADKMPLAKNENLIIKYFGCLLWSAIAMILALMLPDTIFNLFAGTK